MICHYWYFKDIGYKYEPHVSNKCHDLLMVVYDLKSFMILSIKIVDYGCYASNMSRSDAINLLKNSWLDNKGVLQWILVQIKNLFKKVHLGKLILETGINGINGILVLMVRGIKSHRKNLIC